MNPKTITASIVASQRRQSDAERITELERRVALLEALIARKRRIPIHTRLLEIIADGANWSIAQLAETACYQRNYVITNMRILEAEGHVVCVRRGVYRRAQ